MGFVYLVQCHHFYKIGVTKKEGSRTWDTDNPYDVVCLRHWKSAYRHMTENRLHALFLRYHHRGEWFILPKDVCSTLLAVQDIDTFASKWGTVEYRAWLDNIPVP